MANPYDEEFGTGAQVEFARKMAEALLKRDGKLSPEVMAMPRGWMTGAPDIINAIGGARYRNIAGKQDSTLREKMIDPNYNPPPSPPSIGSKILSSLFGANKTPKTAPITTESITLSPSPEANISKYKSPGLVEKAELPNIPTNVNESPGAISPENKISNISQAPNEVINRQVPVQDIKIPKPINPSMAPIEPELRGTDTSEVPGINPKPAFAPGMDPSVTPELKGTDTSEVPGFSPKPAFAPNMDPTTKLQGRIPPQGMMKLGGEPSAVRESSGEDKLAQAFEAKTGTPGGTKIIDIPGYRGPAPDIPYLETQNEIMAQIKAASSLNDAQKIMAEWRSRSNPQLIAVPNGHLMISPKQGGGGTYKFIHGEGKDRISPESIPIYPTFDEKGNTKFPMKIPSGSGASPSGEGPRTGRLEDVQSHEDFVKYTQRLQREGASDLKLSDTKTGIIDEAIKAGGPASQELLNTINTMDTISQSSSDISRSATQPFLTAARQVINNFLPNETFKGSSSEEVLNKLNSVLASESTKAINSNRGSNFELQTFMRANPDLVQSKYGFEMLLDILRQDVKRKQAISKMANRYTGGSVDKFQGAVEEYYRNNPIVIRKPIVEGSRVKRYDFITTKEIHSTEDLEGLKPGTKFITPSGKIGTVP
jgi:hypothetical protein